MEHEFKDKDQVLRLISQELEREKRMVPRAGDAREMWAEIEESLVLMNEAFDEEVYSRAQQYSIQVAARAVRFLLEAPRLN